MKRKPTKELTQGPISLKWTEGTKIDQMDLVDQIGPNRNSLIFKENKLFLTNFGENVIHCITVQNNYLFPSIV